MTHELILKITSEPKNISIGDHSATLFRNKQGVIQIDTEDPVSLAKFTGFCHAMDRQSQMMLVRLIGKGQLCQYLKDDQETLEIDIFMREMAFEHQAKKELQNLDPETYQFAKAYCDGVNEYILHHPRPFEFKLTGYKPEIWEISDILITIKLMSYIGLAQTQQDIEKFIALSLKNEVHLEKLQSLFFPHLEGIDQETLELLKKTHIYRETVPNEIKFLGALPKIMASNNWVINAKKSKSGHAIHCADPHLETNRLPSIWYEQVGKTVSNYYIGITMPGVPGFIMGRNQDLAFSFSYGFMDMIDYFIEEVNNGHYREDNGLVPLYSREEIIKRKKNPDYVFHYYETPRGPIEVPPSDGPIKDGFYLSRAWSGHEGGEAPSLQCIHEMHRMANVKEASKLVSKITISCNWLLSDGHGEIAYQQSGLLPKRQHSGLYPVPGFRKENQWQGIYSPDNLAHTLNPSEGFLVTANNDLNQDGKPLSINMPMGSYRADRIKMLLQNTDFLDTDDMMQIQKDLYSLQAKKLIDLIAPFIKNSGKAELLNKWDLRYDKNSLGATIFEMLYKKILIEIFGSKCFGKEVMEHIIDNTGIVVDYYHVFDKILLDEGYERSEMWFDGDRPEKLKLIIHKFLEELDVKKVTIWGEKNSVVMKNIFFNGTLPGFMGFDYGPIPVEGSRSTVVQGMVYQTDGRITTFCPSWRFITEMNHDFAYTALAGGVSDRRFSKLYLTDVDNWLNYRYKTLSSDLIISLK